MRRTIVTLTTIAFSLLVVPLAACAQPVQTVYRIGLLGTQTSYPSDDYIWAPLLEGLREFGYAEGQNLVIERRYAQGKLERLPNFRAPDMGAEIYATPGASYTRVSDVPGY